MVPPRGGTAGRARIASYSHISRAYALARERLLAEQHADGYWPGWLSSSALSTATAVSALSGVSRERFAGLINRGLDWLEADQNADGGWGDTPDSPSNLATTLLVRAALRLGEREFPGQAQADGYVAAHAGAAFADWAQALAEIYGKDRTFAVPILMNVALSLEAAGGEDAELWRRVASLPFELACLPHAAFRAVRLHVVSYALPALIAIGQLIHARRPTRNPLWRALRHAAIGPTLRKLEKIQPASGGYLEATPITSFVAMSLAAVGRADHSVAKRAVQFLVDSVRGDGSWPIDTNLTTWVTTLSTMALSAGGHAVQDNGRATAEWLLAQQHRVVHPYTNSPPGGWAWTDLSGGVPDADDTAGALLALKRLGHAQAADAARPALRWLLGIQNADGGWPTFCRGWGKLPFDRSAPDLTAHALRAIAAWRGVLGRGRPERAIARGLEYLCGAQRADGAWIPLWFGNQSAPAQENPVYGTARVLRAYAALGRSDAAEAQAGVGYLERVQNDDGGWGGAAGAPSTMEETAVAVEALATWPEREPLAHGAHCLAGRVLAGGLDEPAPIGLYFAKLWYWERLYPIIFSVAALGRMLGSRGERGSGA